MTIEEALQQLLETLKDSRSGDERIEAASQSLFRAAGKTSREHVGEALRPLSEAFFLDDGKRAAFAATVCGALIECGADPSAIAGPLTEKLGLLLTKAAALAQACLGSLPQDDEDHAESFDRKRKELAASMPDESAAWDDLERFWPAGIAVYSASPTARAGAKALRQPASRIAEYHPAGHWLSAMLSVLHEEPFLAVEPDSGLGIEGRMSGIADNFQLHVLLMDAFPRRGLFALRRVSRQAARVARGSGPQVTDEIISGKWNLYTWEGLGPDARLPDAKQNPSTEAWVWGEGTPADIPVFEGYRVVLLGPPSYLRTWRSQRLFQGLRAELEISKRLTREEVQRWLERMAQAARTKRS